MNKKESIEQFLAPKKLVIAGVSRNPKKFGYVVFNELRQKGFAICPVNPNLDEIDGVKCYKSILDVPDDFKKLLILTPKTETDKVLEQAAEKGIKHIWVQQMANTQDTEQIAKKLNIDIILKECIFMYAEPVKGIHKFHKVIWKLFRKLPK